VLGFGKVECWLAWFRQEKFGEETVENFETYRSSPLPISSAAAAERVTAFLRKVYGWMCAGLAITALVALEVASSPAILRGLVENQFLFLGLLLAELGLVFYLSARAARLAPGTAMALFVVYAALNGVTLSFVFLAYTGQSVTNAFVVTAGMFGGMALYGSTTKRSLAGVGQFVFMGLIGLVLASLVGLFWHNDTLQFVISAVGVIVFTGLAAWDAQRLKQMALAIPEGQIGSFAIVGALSLYLDFINLFLSLLRLFGSRRE
jgi:FtsH-binding integral membrane protein